MKINLFTVVVVYQQDLSDSDTINSIVDNQELINKMFNRFSFLIYDNSPKSQKFNISLPFNTNYYSDIQNGGISTAYNYAYKLAQSEFDWILLLDQDTILTKEYFLELSEILGNVVNNNDIVSVVPKISDNNIIFSPSRVLWGGIHRPIQSESNGIFHDGELMAIGSGSLLRISFIDENDGFNRRFKLDCQDRWIYQSIYKAGKKCYIMREKINHQLSILDFNNRMNISKYIDQIYYEALYMLIYRKKAEVFFFVIRMIRRGILLIYKTGNYDYFNASITLIKKMFYSVFFFS